MKRVLTALVLITVFGYLILWAPDLLFQAAAAAVAIVCFREYAHLASLHEIQKPGVFGYAAGLVVLLLPQRETALIVVMALLAMSLALRSRDLTETLPFAAALILGVLYIFGSLRCAVDLRAMSRYWVFFALSLNWVGDIAALYVGIS